MMTAATSAVRVGSQARSEDTNIVIHPSYAEEREREEETERERGREKEKERERKGRRRKEREGERDH